jgi:hypothetical protein
VIDMKTGLFAVIALLCALAPGLAQARPRDQVMSGAFRCAAIGNSRVWLDCYYGAAQPQRAELGLPPAPASQLKLASSPPQGTPADPQVRDAVLSGAFRCNDIADERQWLDCYYAAAQPMRARLGLSPAPQAARTAALPARVPTAPRQAGASPAGGFGLSAPERPVLAENVDHVVSRMASYSFNKYGIFTAKLANGQVWRQLSGDTSYAHWRKPAGTYVATISRGWFGSYNFQVKGSPGMFKVQRER